MSSRTRRHVPLVLVQYAITLGFLLVAWHLYVVTAQIPRYLLPAPVSVLEEMAAIMSDGSLWANIGHTVTVLGIGLGIGTVVGLFGGYVLAKSPTIDRYAGPYIFLFQTAPKIALAPLFLLWFGLGITSKLVLVTTLVFFPILVSTLTGIRSVASEFRGLSSVLGLTRFQLFSRIESKAALPYVFSGLRIAVIQATIGAILAEWLAGDSGLGFLMVYGSRTFNTELLLVAIVVTVVLSVAVYMLVVSLERALVTWWAN